MTSVANYVNDGSLRQYVITYDSSSRVMNFLRDNTSICNITIDAGGTGISANNLRVGYWDPAPAGRRLEGYSRQLCAFSRVLSSGELSSLYNSGSGLFII